MHILLVALLIFPINSCSNKEEDSIVKEKVKPQIGTIPILVGGTAVLSGYALISNATMSAHLPDVTEAEVNDPPYIFNSTANLIPPTPMLRVDEARTQVSHNLGSHLAYFVVDRSANDTGTYYFRLDVSFTVPDGEGGVDRYEIDERTFGITLARPVSNQPIPGSTLIRSSYSIRIYDNIPQVREMLPSLNFTSHNPNARINLFISENVPREEARNGNVFEIDLNADMMDVPFEESASDRVLRRLNETNKLDVTCSNVKRGPYGLGFVYVLPQKVTNTKNPRYNSKLPSSLLSFVTYEYQAEFNKKIYKYFETYNTTTKLNTKNTFTLVYLKAPRKVTGIIKPPGMLLRLTYTLVSSKTGILTQNISQYDGIQNKPSPWNFY